MYVYVYEKMLLLLSSKNFTKKFSESQSSTDFILTYAQPQTTSSGNICLGSPTQTLLSIRFDREQIFSCAEILMCSYT